jgi:hypothetical protein
MLDASDCRARKNEMESLEHLQQLTTLLSWTNITQQQQRRIIAILQNKQRDER